MQPLSVPLCPKLPHGPLRVLVIGRISTEHQNLENIDASYRFVGEYLGRVYDGPIEVKHLGERASGMLSGRATIREAEDLVASGEWDLVIAEDLSRIFRNPRHQYNFVQDAVDAETRVICIGDNLDTADENWEIMMGAATLRHGTAIPDIRRRVRRTATHAFHRGGMVLKVKYGYRKLSQAEADSGDFGPRGLRLAKRPECTPVIREMLARVMRGDHYAAVADWLIETQIAAPPHARRWKPRLVKELLESPILSGMRSFRRTIYRPVFRTGKHRRLKNAEPELEECPDLAHLTTAEHTALLEVMSARAAGHAGRAGRQHPLANRPRSRVLWPAQQLHCAICGGLFYASEQEFKCSNSRMPSDPRCWNHVQVPASLARQRILGWLRSQLYEVSGFREELLRSTWSHLREAQSRPRATDATLAREVRELEAQAAHLTDAIACGGRLEALVERLQAVSSALIAARRRAQEAEPSPQPKPLWSQQDVNERLDSMFLSLAETSVEFADWLRGILGVVIQPVQALDTPLVRPRAKLTLRLPGGSSQHGEIEATVDLFEPPLSIRYAGACSTLRQENPRWSGRQIAAQLGIHVMTVKRAFDYARLMERQEMTEPYRELHSAPEQASRWVRR